MINNIEKNIPEKENPSVLKSGAEYILDKTNGDHVLYEIDQESKILAMIKNHILGEIEKLKNLE
jgi:uncharacterized phage-like protein YoqJ